MPFLKNISDKLLVEMVNRDDGDAFRELFNRYTPRIYRFAVDYLKNKDDAEELVQEVFVKLWESRHLFDSSQNIRAYIFKVAVNTIYDFIRRKNLAGAYHDYIARDTGEGAEHTWHEVVLDDLLANLERLKGLMPEQRRVIFVLSKEKGLSNDEIARSLGLSKRTVENQLYRALLFLKARLGSLYALAMLWYSL